jgi:hypothetical protein
VVEPGLSATALTAHNIRALLRNDEWIAIGYRNVQLVFIDEFTQTQCAVTLDTAALAEQFGLIRSRLQTIRAKGQRKQWRPHRPLALSDEQRFQLCEMI